MIQRLIILLFVCVLCFNVCEAQDFQKGITSKGVKIGFGSSVMSTSYDELKPYLEYKIGFHGGFFLNYQIDPKFSIQPEILLAVKGTKEGTFLSLFDWSNNYLEVPVLFKYKLGDSKAVKPHIYAGPSFSYLLKSEFDILFVDPIDVTDGMKRTDLGLIFGGGFDYKKIVFEVRYTIGMTNIIDSDKINIITEAEPDDFYYFTADPDVKNAFFSFMFGYKF